MAPQITIIPPKYRMVGFLSTGLCAARFVPQLSLMPSYAYGTWDVGGLTVLSRPPSLDGSLKGHYAGLGFEFLKQTIRRFQSFVACQAHICRELFLRSRYVPSCH